MGARIGNFLATLMLSVPLSAAALMAIFGVPPLSQVIASPELQRIVRGAQPSNDTWTDLASTPASTTDFQDAPAFGATSAFTTPANAPVSTPIRPSSTPSEAPRSWTDPAAGAPAAFPQQSSPLPSGGRGFAADVPLHQNGQPQQLAASGNGLSWRQASLRLNELGISDFHVEPGSTEGQFLFVCVYRPVDAPHVAHRFEAEAEDPLQAVNSVLQQVETWMRQRFGATNNSPRSESSATLWR